MVLVKLECRVVVIHSRKLKCVKITIDKGVK